MTEDRQARRFQEELDEVLDAAVPAPDRDFSEETDREMLEIAARLASTDFSAESHVRESLREEVVQRSSSVRRMAMFAWFGRIWGSGSLVLGPATAALVMLVVMIAWPGAVAAAADGIEQFVRRLVLDETTSVRQATDADRVSIPGLDRGDPVTEEGRAVIWVARTTVRELDGSETFPGDGRETKTYTDPKLAQEDLEFRLRLPAELPEGYSLARIRLTPTGWALSHYEGPGGQLILAHVPRDAPDPGDAEAGFGTTVEVLTDDPITAATVNGAPAAWIEGQSLSWVDDGVTYTLGGGQLTLAEAVRVAESLR
jgi:hypothetical protein